MNLETAVNEKTQRRSEEGIGLGRRLPEVAGKLDSRGVDAKFSG